MLIAKPETPAINDIVAVRTNSGEEIVGRFVRLTADEIELAKPLLVSVQQVGPGQMGLGLIPVMVSTELANMTLSRASLLVDRPMKVRRDVEQGYTRQTSSIAVPNGKETASILQP